MSKKIITAIITFIIALSSCAVVMAGTVNVNLTIGVGETKSLTNYLKTGAKVSKWTNSSPNVVKVSAAGVTGTSVGTSTIKGSSGSDTYVFTVKVLKNFSGYKNLENKTSKQVENSKGEKLTYHDRYITMGVKDSISLTNLLNAKKKYFNYTWSFSDKGLIRFTAGKVTALKPGIIHIKAISNSKDEKNHIYNFYITIADNSIAKNISVRKETLTNLGNYIGDDAANYVFSVKSATGGAVQIKDNQYIAAGTGTGTSIVTAESTTGGTNYTFIVKIV